MSSTVATPIEGTIQRIPVTRRLIVSFVVLPAFAVLILGIAIFAAHRAAAGRLEKARSISAGYKRAEDEYRQIRGTVETLNKDVRQLNANRYTIDTRINALETELGITPEYVGPTSLRGAAFAIQPMTPASDLFRFRVASRSPQALQQFFTTLESEFPGLSVVQSSIARVDDRIAIETTYLLPNYAVR